MCRCRGPQTAAKKAARRENAEILGTELPQEADDARTFERRGGWDDGGWGDQGEGRGRGGREQWEPRGGRGRESRGRRGGQFDNRDEKRYDDRNNWGKYDDSENSQGWFDGDNNNWTRGRNEGFDGPAENFRVNGVTDDGRNTWVSHGNTWNQWDDDADDGAGKPPKGRGAAASEADKQWAAFDDDKNWEWLDGEGEGDGKGADKGADKGASARRDIMDDWLGDDDIGDNDTWALEGDSRAKDPNSTGGGAKGWGGAGDDAWAKGGFAADLGDEHHGGGKGWRNNDSQKSSSESDGAWGNMNIWDDVDLPMSTDSPSGRFGMDKGSPPTDDQWSKWDDGEGRPQGRGQQQQQQQQRRHRGGSEWDDGPDAFWTDGAFGDDSSSSDDVGRWLDDLEDAPAKGAARGMANSGGAAPFGGDGMCVHAPPPPPPPPQFSSGRCSHIIFSFCPVYLSWMCICPDLAVTGAFVGAPSFRKQAKARSLSLA